MCSQRELAKVYGEIKRKQRHSVKSRHTKDIFAIFLENSLIFYLKCVSYFQTTGNARLPWARVSNEEYSYDVDLKHSQDLEILSGKGAH